MYSKEEKRKGNREKTRKKKRSTEEKGAMKTAVINRL
jgi:hypothetical protein